jgi:hypothetical protein
MAEEPLKIFLAMSMEESVEQVVTGLSVKQDGVVSAPNASPRISVAIGSFPDDLI